MVCHGELYPFIAHPVRHEEHFTLGSFSSLSTHLLGLPASVVTIVRGRYRGSGAPPPPLFFEKILFICNTNCSPVGGWTPPPFKIPGSAPASCLFLKGGPGGVHEFSFPCPPPPTWSYILARVGGACLLAFGSSRCMLCPTYHVLSFSALLMP